ncbi:hypothetical protein [Methylobacterium oryzisoli]|uniref:hypothetical protein n=1 Tax=Methylobacterium oryzisoli TaxID=3385502 RepID=UPI00397DA0C7
MALRTAGAVGPAAGTVYKVVGTDTLPSGASYDSGTKRVTVSTAGVTLDGWDFTGGKSLAMNAEGITLRNSKFDAGTNLTQCVVYGTTATPQSGLIERCSFDGARAISATYNASIKCKDGTGGLTIQLCDFRDMPADNVVAGESNSPGSLLVLGAQSTIRRNTFGTGAWGNPSAHYDAITLNCGDWLVYENYFDLTPFNDGTQAGTTYGTNNCLRLFGFNLLRLDVYNSILTGHETLSSYPLDVNGDSILSARIRDNLIRPNAGGGWRHPGAGAILQSSGNRNAQSQAPLVEIPAKTYTPPAITSTATRNIVESTPFTFEPTADQPVTWSVSTPETGKWTLTTAPTAGSKPTLAFATPAQSANSAAGSKVYTATLTATNGAGQTTSQTVNFTVIVAPARKVSFYDQLVALNETPAAPRKSAYDTLLDALTLGATSQTKILDRLDFLYVLEAPTLLMARQNLIADRYNATVVGAPVFVAGQGFRGNGGTGYLETGYNPTVATDDKFTQTDSCAGVYTRTLGGINDGYLVLGTQVGIQSGGTTAATVSSRLVTTANMTTTGSFLPGFVNANRTTAGGNNYTIGSGDSRETVNRGTLAITSATFAVGKSVPNTSAGGQIMAAWAGGSLTQAEETDLRNALRTFFIATGAIAA